MFGTICISLGLTVNLCVAIFVRSDEAGVVFSITLLRRRLLEANAHLPAMAHDRSPEVHKEGMAKYKLQGYSCDP
jgi:hypothetical protein